MAAGISSLAPPVFVPDADGLSPSAILADIIATFEAAAGKTLQPAQPEQLQINNYAYREALVRNAIQYAGQQNLLAFASYPMLDYLGQLLGVARLAGQPATTSLEFTLAQALTVPYTIPAGTLVGTTDGMQTFATDAPVTIPAGQTTWAVFATAVTPGVAANGYPVGAVSVLLNPDALIGSVTNTIPTAGGSAPETDDHLRSRIQGAPNQFAVAGPTGAYRYLALNADPSIIDAQVSSPAPGQVLVCILTGPPTVPAPVPNDTGIAGATLLAEVLAALSADTVRPLTDQVSVVPVSEVDYAINATLELYADADVSQVLAAAQTAAQEFAQNLANRIQRDIVPEQIIAALTVAGVYRVTLTAPVYTQLQPGQWANCTSISLVPTVASEDS